MASRTLRCSFIAFHVTLGLVLLVLSVRTAVYALGPGGAHSPHVAALAILEAAGALLFLLPKSLRAGGVLLLLSIGLGMILHATAHQFRADLLVYAVGTWFVTVHGSAWGANRATSAAR